MIRFGQEGMKRILEILNEIKNKGLIKDYAIAGGIASVYYIEAIGTKDLDIFITIKSGSERDMAKVPFRLFNYFASKGYGSDGDYIFVDHIPVHLTFADEPIQMDAVRDAKDIEFAGVKTRVLRAEYLIAMYSEIQRSHLDLEKIERLMKIKIDKNLLDSILKKYKLHNPLEKKCGRHLR